MPADRSAAARAIDEFLRAIGRDPESDPALRATGARVADAFIDDLCDGYAVDVPSLLAREVIDGRADLVVVRDIAVTTTCPHHLLPAQGFATVAFAPSSKIVGVGAVVRTLDAFAHRLALQEAIGQEVTGALMAALRPAWAGCRLVLSHSCMTARGERRHGAKVETISLAGGVEPSLAHRALGLGGGT